MTTPAKAATDRQRYALQALEEHGPCSARDLARLSQVTPAAAQMTLARLLRAGFVSRSRVECRAERWAYRVTPAGRRSMRRLVSPANEELCLALMRVRRPATARVLARHMDIERTAAWRRIERARQRGLIFVCGTRETGRRGRPLHLFALTESGRQAALIASHRTAKELELVTRRTA